MFENLRNETGGANENAKIVIENINNILNNISGEFSVLTDAEILELSSVDNFKGAVGGIISE